MLHLAGSCGLSSLASMLQRKTAEFSGLSHINVSLSPVRVFNKLMVAEAPLACRCSFQRVVGQQNATPPAKCVVLCQQSGHPRYSSVHPLHCQRHELMASTGHARAAPRLCHPRSSQPQRRQLADSRAGTHNKHKSTCVMPRDHPFARGQSIRSWPYLPPRRVENPPSNATT